MNRIQKLFAAKKGVFTAFLTIGAPTLDGSIAAAKKLLASGADILELGVPFSDPMADGPVIREAAGIALGHGVTLADVLAAAKVIRADFPYAPLVVFSYYNVIFKYGLERFAKDAVSAGVDAVLAVDVPVEERDELLAPLRKEGLTLVPLVAPTTSIERCAKIAEGLEDSFLYAVTVRGVTGTRTELPPELAERLAAIKRAVKMPVCAGFGVSTHEQAEMISRVADGFVVGSALVKKTLLPDAEATGFAEMERLASEIATPGGYV
ncbi:MAG: tryptophan synthase subunit alpha [Kiritimatiellae bacterium]|nr:tryptophan synthase subunit alpha [Kiritimatiellia bacterium]